MFVRAALAALVLSLGVTSVPAQALEPAPTVTPSWTTHNQARVNWTAVAGAQYYKVNYALSNTFAGGVAKFTTSNTIVLSSLQASTTYYVRVLAINASKVVISGWSTTAQFTTKPAPPPPVNVVVGNFNIKDPDSNSATAWDSRRPYIAKDIQAGYLDVLGTQEAYEEDEQQDLLDSVNDAGTRNYKMTPEPSFTDSDADAWDNRILYRDPTVELVVPAVVYRYKNQDPETTDPDKYRKLVYATFKKNGKSFVFLTTHLAPGNDGVAYRQWTELLWIAKNKNPSKYPVIIAGDFNSTKFGYEACKMLKPMLAAGFGDVLGQQCQTYTTYRQRAVKKYYANVNSFNGLNKRIADYSVGAGRIGNNVDWIFASNHLKVPQWHTHVTQSGGYLTWPIRSDHFMVSAIVTLP